MTCNTPRCPTSKCSEVRMQSKICNERRNIKPQFMIDVK